MADSTINPRCLQDHYRVPDGMLRFKSEDSRQGKAGYFRLGSDCTAFGRITKGRTSASAASPLVDISPDIRFANGYCVVPFDPDELVSNLLEERYVAGRGFKYRLRKLGKAAYYHLRPVLPFAVRARVKRFSQAGWQETAFPQWPLDRTADRIREKALVFGMQAQGLERIPFIWFWPKQYSSVAVMTHDVEAIAGLNFCSDLMDLNDQYGIKSSFQLVPEGRYTVPGELLKEARDRGFEINVHDWNHDGQLFSTHKVFRSRVDGINRFAAQIGAEGFRSGALYRNLEWHRELQLSYDMSVPNVGHLDPQPGGCCTLFPYFIGELLEIPLTAVQDYMLFHMLGSYSIDLWKQQIESIVQCNGLASFIVHPDYILERNSRHVYQQLLEYLAKIRTEQGVWIALPGEVNRWWRKRAQMSLIFRDGAWVVEGKGSEDACVAFASIHQNHLKYELAAEACVSIS